MDRKMTLRMFVDVFGGLSAASMLFVIQVLRLMDGESVLRIRNEELGEILFPEVDINTATVKVSRRKRALKRELEDLRLECFGIGRDDNDGESYSVTAYAFDYTDFRERADRYAPVN